MRTHIARPHRAITLAIAALIVVAVAAAAAPSPIPHPSGANELILRIDTTPNFFGGTYDDGETIVIGGDGRVTITPPTGPRSATPQPESVQSDEVTIQKILRRARRIGLLGKKPPDTGESFVTDQGTTTIEVHAAGVDRTIGVYALLLPDGDHGLTTKQRHERRGLRAFAHDLTRPDYYRAGTSLS